MSNSRNIEPTSGIFHVRQQKSQLGIEAREEAKHEDTNAERSEGSSEARESGYHIRKTFNSNLY